MRLIGIAAIGARGELGLKNDMPWARSLKKDLAFFKEITLNHPVLMGKNTWLSLKKPLAGRKNLVITSSRIDHPEISTLKSLTEFLTEYENYEGEVFVIGGAQLYRSLIDQMDEIFLTEIDSDFEADCYFPDFDKENFKRVVLDQDTESGLSYRHVHYIRKKDSDEAS